MAAAAAGVIDRSLSIRVADVVHSRSRKRRAFTRRTHAPRFCRRRHLSCHPSRVTPCGIAPLLPTGQTRMNPKHFHTPVSTRLRCPVCHQPVYSRGGIHPQCAMRQSEPPMPSPRNRSSRRSRTWPLSVSEVSSPSIATGVVPGPVAEHRRSRRSCPRLAAKLSRRKSRWRGVPPVNAPDRPRSKRGLYAVHRAGIRLQQPIADARADAAVSAGICPAALARSRRHRLGGLHDGLGVRRMSDGNNPFSNL